MTLPKALQQSLRCPLLGAVSECAVSPAMHRSALLMQHHAQVCCVEMEPPHPRLRRFISWCQRG